jgi:hypothetical protein
MTRMKRDRLKKSFDAFLEILLKNQIQKNSDPCDAICAPARHAGPHVILHCSYPLLFCFLSSLPILSATFACPLAANDHLCVSPPAAPRRRWRRLWTPPRPRPWASGRSFRRGTMRCCPPWSHPGGGGRVCCCIRRRCAAPTASATSAMRRSPSSTGSATPAAPYGR